MKRNSEVNRNSEDEIIEVNEWNKRKKEMKKLIRNQEINKERKGKRKIVDII